MLVLIMLFQCQTMSPEYINHLNRLYLDRVLHATKNFVQGTAYPAGILIPLLLYKLICKFRINVTWKAP